MGSGEVPDEAPEGAMPEVAAPRPIPSSHDLPNDTEGFATGWPGKRPRSEAAQRAREKREQRRVEAGGEELGWTFTDGLMFILGGYFDQNRRLPASDDEFSLRVMQLIGESPARDFEAFSSIDFSINHRVYTVQQFGKTLTSFSSMKMLDDSPNGKFVYEEGGFWDAVRELEEAAGEDELRVYNQIADQLAKEFYKPVE